MQMYSCLFSGQTFQLRNVERGMHNQNTRGMCHSIVGFLCSIQFNVYDLVVIYYSITFLCVTCFFNFLV